MSLPTSQTAHCVYITKISRLILFTNVIAEYSENRMKYIWGGQNAEFFNVK
jgi:hypothetical protein